MTYLPDELLCMVCSELWHQRDFVTLFNCACSGKQLAKIATSNLYRIQKGACRLIPGHFDEEWLSRDRALRQSAGLWRTIILSSLGKTLYPYSQYIRVLSLRDLDLLLTDSMFRGKTREDFFRGELAQFQIKIRSRLEVEDSQLILDETINRIGEVITKQTPLLEELTGEVSSGFLSRWIPRLPRLAHLDTWYGVVTEGTGTLIRLHCPSFKGLNLPLRDRRGFDPSCQDLAAFLNELRPQSIETFQPLAYNGLGPELLKALTCHEESLTELKLNFSKKTISNLALLKGCTNLVFLSLTEYEDWLWDPDREKLCNDGFREALTWLKGCKKLRKFALLGNMMPSLIGPILLENSLHLTSLTFSCAYMFDAKNFYRALANHTSLQSLWLQQGMGGDDVKTDVLVECLSKLVNLTELRLEQISEYLVDRHIVQLAGSLPKLKSWWTHGCIFTDAIWDEVASLRSLQRLQIRAFTSFTADGILDFIAKLGPGNRGLALFVIHEVKNMEENNDKDQYSDEGVFSWNEQELMRKEIAIKVEGRFTFVNLILKGALTPEQYCQWGCRPTRDAYGY